MTVFKPDDSQPLVLVRANEAEILGIAPNTIQLLADGGTDGALSAVRTRMAKGTDGPPPHYHERGPEIFFIIEGSMHALAGEQILTVREGDYLLVPPRTTHAFCTPDDIGVDMLFMMPGVERFDYFRLGDRVRKGEASPSEILESQDRFDNHFEDSEIWRQFRGAAADRILSQPPEDGRPHTY
jgi:mannose-6-phosphate isomerase-like protein (cupin superfamily)